MSDRLPMSRPEIDASDVAAVREVLESGRIALGPRAERFEERFAAYVGTGHAVAMNSGTSVLHVIIRALGLGPGDEVIVPSFTFVASVNALLFEGVTPRFADIDPDTLCLSPAAVASGVNDRTRAILAVDLFGHPADWDALRDLSSAHGLELIDDACEALGSTYRGRRIGGQGRAAAFGFYPNKQITTGEGGMLVTDDGGLAGAARSLRNQGREATGTWLEHARLGFSYRMSEIHAALGLSQLSRIDELLARRERVARLYDERLAGVASLCTPFISPEVTLSRFLYYVRLDEDRDRSRVAELLESRGVPSRGYFPPVHRQPYIVDRLGETAGLEETERAGRSILALPFHGRMTEGEVDRVVSSLEHALESGRASR